MGPCPQTDLHLLDLQKDLVHFVADGRVLHLQALKGLEHAVEALGGGGGMRHFTFDGCGAEGGQAAAN